MGLGARHLRELVSKEKKVVSLGLNDISMMLWYKGLNGGPMAQAALIVASTKSLWVATGRALCCGMWGTCRMYSR